MKPVRVRDPDNAILVFEGEHDFLSNFHPSPIEMDRVVWPTVEHLYQARKSDSHVVREMIRKCSTPAEAKQWGQKVALRSDWQRIKRQVMASAVRHKFAQHVDLRACLLATGTRYLEEGNTWGDRYWGVCPPGSGDGENHLGRILMQTRSELRSRLT